MRTSFQLQRVDVKYEGRACQICYMCSYYIPAAAMSMLAVGLQGLYIANVLVIDATNPMHPLICGVQINENISLTRTESENAGCPIET